MVVISWSVQTVAGNTIRSKDAIVTRQVFGGIIAGIQVALG
jgi:hypothetical protein